MGRPMPPCKDCPDRHTACWDSCSAYKEFSEANRKLKEAIRNDTIRENEWSSVVYSKRTRPKKFR